MTLNLNEKEQFIAKHVALGLSNKEIAARLDTTEQYVKFLLVRVFNKTGMFNRVELTKFMLEHGLVAKSPAPQDFSSLTPKELIVVRAVKEGYTTKEIAGQLEIDPITVRRHLSRVYSKLKVRSRSQLMAILVYNAGYEAEVARVNDLSPEKGT